MAKLGISTGTVPNDGNGDSLLIGAIKINSNFNEIYNYFGDGTNLNFNNVDVWNRTGSGINTLSNVGIATTNPRFSLEVGSIGAAGTSLWVNGNARVTGIFTVGSSSITLNGSSNTISVGTGVTIYGNTGIISATDFYANGLRVGVISATTIVYQGGTLYNTWQQAASGIHTLSNVGIGTTNATSRLTVKGNTSLETLNVSGVSTFVGVSTFIGVSNFVTANAQTINVNTGGINVAANIPAYFGNTSEGYIAFLSGSNSFNIRTPGGVAPLVLGAGTVRITNGDASSEFARFTGIGLTVTGTTFTNQLSVSGVSTFVGVSTFNGGAYFNSPVYYSNNPTRAYFGSLNEMSIYSTGTYTGTSFNYIDANSGYIDIRNLRTTIRNPETTTQRDLAIFDATTFNGEFVKLYYGGNEKFATVGTGATVTGTTFTNQLSVSGISTFSGNVAIGTINPTSKLTVRDGDISVGVSTAHGVILTSPNGTQYRLIVANNGTLSTVAV